MSQITGWTALDDRAVAYARALAMDSVQKVGNGHPGTAMALAPVAYNLFQRHLIHDPSDPHWLGARSFHSLVWTFIAHSLHTALLQRLRTRDGRYEIFPNLGFSNARSS
jgi:hypothetical protein